MDKILKERYQMQWNFRRLHSPEVTTICRREVKRYFDNQIGGWHCEGWIIDTVQNDLGFEPAQIKTQLKNLVGCDVLVKKFDYREGTRQIIGTLYKKRVRSAGQTKMKTFRVRFTRRDGRAGKNTVDAMSPKIARAKVIGKQISSKSPIAYIDSIQETHRKHRKER
jgi:hypothetical protein